MGPLEIRAGGQTGVDRAALDAALAAGLPCGGWCPAGRRAEDGPLPPRYPLRETASADPAERTLRNVRDADALLVLSRGAPRGGTALAVAEAARLGRPRHAVRLGAPDADPDPVALAAVERWLRAHAVRRLNVAGPRESEEPGIGVQARHFLDALLARAGAPPGGGPRASSAGPRRG